jgi:DNA-binding NtrC family response regulator
MEKHVLIVDDDANLRAIVAEDLRQRGYRVTVTPSPDEVHALLVPDEVDVVLTDVEVHGCCGFDLCARIVESGRDVPVVVMTASGSMDSAVAAIRAGAHDFVSKPPDMEELAATLDRAANGRALRSEARGLRDEVAEPPCEDEFLVGTSPAMVQTVELIQRVAPTDATILVTGETGTGKELVARAIHAGSERAGGPFVAVNCAATPESLLESELFGHTKGAFTNACQAREGLFVKAAGGTLFLDEIGEMPVCMQAKLLRALQERTVRPVGGDAEVVFDARIVAATNLDLEREVAEGRFREDLFFRIDVVHVSVPPLRARGRDVLSVAAFLLRKHQPGSLRVVGLTPAVIQAFLSYPWPGNVRELENVIQRAVALAQFDHVTPADLPESMRPADAGEDLELEPDSEMLTLREVERRYIAQVLRATKNNKARAARVLGFDRRTLYRKLAAQGTCHSRPRCKARIRSAA